MQTRLSTLILLSILALAACQSRDTYFELDELQTLVRERRAAKELLSSYGPQQGTFPETVFTVSAPSAVNEADLEVEQVDDFYVTELSGAGQESLVFDEADPWAHAKLSDSDQSLAIRQSVGLKSTSASDSSVAQSNLSNLHFSDTVYTDFCETRSASLKYQARRDDINGYTEHQYTLFYLDASQNVCGFMTRSLFKTRSQ